MNYALGCPPSSGCAAVAMAAPSSGGQPDAFHGGSMFNTTGTEERGPPVPYSQPRLSRLGTFRELTRSGGMSFSDMFATDGSAGCVMKSSSSYTCTKV